LFVEDVDVDAAVAVAVAVALLEPDEFAVVVASNEETFANAAYPGTISPSGSRKLLPEGQTTWLPLLIGVPQQ
jgi:hypothetical protein